MDNRRVVAAVAAVLVLAIGAVAPGQQILRPEQVQYEKERGVRWVPEMGDPPGFVPTEADALDRVVPGEFFVDPPTIHSLGFRWYIQGDANRNAEVAVAYRKKGDAQWREALPMLRVHFEVSNQEYGPWRAGNLFAGSVMFLDPGTEYEVRFTMSDPDGGAPGPKIVTAKTRTEPPVYEGERTVPVLPADHEGPRPEGAAADLAAALDQARPGDVLLLLPGVHRGAFTISTSGEEGRPIVLRGSDQGQAVVEGPEDAPETTLFDVSQVSHLHIENLLMRRARIAVHGGNRGGPENSRIVLRGCRIEDVWAGVWIYSENSENWYISDNVIIGRNSTWYPRTEPGRGYLEPSHTGVNIYGRGHVVAYNRIARFGDAFAIANYGVPMSDLAKQCLNIDVYHNDLSWAYDDIIETDYGCHNIRVWRNRGYNAHTGLSVQPSFGGPIYLIRNELYGITGLSYKLHNYCTGILAYHNTTASATRNFSGHDRWQNGHFRNNLFMGGRSYQRAVRGREQTVVALAIATGSISPYTTLDYNGYSRNDPAGFISWFDGQTRHSFDSLAEFAEALGHERHGIQVDYDIFVRADRPQMGVTAEPGEWDLRLRPESAAVDAGIRLPNINDDFTGTAPDLGALEFGQPLPHYGPRRMVWGEGESS